MFHSQHHGQLDPQLVPLLRGEPYSVSGCVGAKCAEPASWEGYDVEQAVGGAVVGAMPGVVMKDGG